MTNHIRSVGEYNRMGILYASLDRAGDELLKRTDEAQNLAKSKGKNRVEVIESPTVLPKLHRLI